ncbi:BatB protein [Thermaurantimonas aggregans]|uniref:BatB protein n=1 Tax=Thermaurantimonas aggregans TaxID=2173829 RepID=A0A401XL68_9FLAO|nr:VWA domain-containing protein [Thermaurantimonas aggregans]MCX8148166.1 VWA domain-containing protein [Thermaurantimonas aggregans]GCD77766.1 BatB protein [Thermaurantimonas aggregans]
MNIEFQHIEYVIYGILFALVLFTLSGILINKFKKLSRKIVENIFYEKIFKYYDYKRITSKYILKFFILILLFLSAANPREYTTTRKKESSSCEIIFCLDISNSMLADDISPNRLEFSRQIILNVLKNIQDDKVGLVVYAGTSALLQPMTSDLENVYSLVKNVNTDYILTQGTNIEEALERSISLFNPSSSADKILILLTDGEEHEGQMKRILENLRELNVKLFIVGVGTVVGGPIPVSSNFGKDYKRDKYGNVVITKLNENNLKELAKQLDGLYLHSKSTSQISSILLQEIDKAKRIETERNIQSGYSSLYYIPLIGACILLLIDLIVFDYLYFILKK